MHKIENFGSAHDLALTVLVDNRADLLEESSEAVKRFYDEPLLAEHQADLLASLEGR